MGMSTDEAIRIMNRDSLWDSKEEVEAKNKLINIAKKYQKIVEIVKIVKADSTYSSVIREEIAFQDIVKVIEDGK